VLGQRNLKAYDGVEKNSQSILIWAAFEKTSKWNTKDILR
jgi:hypothetical protein